MEKVSQAVVVDEGRVLIVKRSPSVSYPGLWHIPGGHVEPGESYEECLRREIREELGAQVTKIIRAHPVVDADLNGTRWRVKTFLINIDRIEINRKEISEYRWISPDELPDFETTPHLDTHFRMVGLL